MTVKLLLLKSGEEVISDINEMAVGEEDDQKVVGYFLGKPCIVQKQNPGVIEQNKKQTKAGFEVSLIPWIALSADDIYNHISRIRNADPVRVVAMDGVLDVRIVK